MATLAAIRRRDAVKLKIEGLSIEEIREQLGYRSCAAVRSDIRKELREYGREEVAEALEIELSRLDRATVLVMQIIENGAQDDAEEAQRSKALFAVDRLVALSTRRASFMGLDATQRGPQGTSDVDKWLAGIIDGGPEPNLDPNDILGDELEEVEDIGLD